MPVAQPPSPAAPRPTALPFESVCPFVGRAPGARQTSPWERSARLASPWPPRFPFCWPPGRGGGVRQGLRPRAGQSGVVPTGRRCGEKTKRDIQGPVSPRRREGAGGPPPRAARSEQTSACSLTSSSLNSGLAPLGRRIKSLWCGSGALGSSLQFPQGQRLLRQLDAPGHLPPVLLGA